MQPPPDKKRKLFNDDDEYRQQKEKMLSNSNHFSNPLNNKQGENDWGDDDDDFNNLLTQQENLNRIDSLVASSQQISWKSTSEQNNKVEASPIYNGIKTEGTNSNEKLSIEIKDLQQQLYAKDGEIKFLKQSMSNLLTNVNNQKEHSSKILNEKNSEFENEKTRLENSIKSLKSQLEFKEHELNKTSFAPTNSKFQNRPLATSSTFNRSPGRTRSFGPSTSFPMVTRPSFEGGSGVTPAFDPFLVKKKAQTKEQECQVESSSVIKKIMKVNKLALTSDSRYAGAVLEQQHVMKHFTNQLNHGSTGCPANQSVCCLNVGQSSPPRQLQQCQSKSPNHEKHVIICDELASLRIMYSGVAALIHRSSNQTKLNSSNFIPSFVNFLLGAQEQLVEYGLYLRTRQILPMNSCPTPCNKRKQNTDGFPNGKLATINSILILLRSFLASDEFKSCKDLCKIPVFSEFVAVIFEIINQNPLTNDHGIIIMCLEIVLILMKKSDKVDINRFSPLLDSGGLLMRILQREDNLEKPSSGHHLLSLHVFNILIEFSKSSDFQSNVCRQLNSECILSVVTSLMPVYRTTKNIGFLAIHKQFYSIVGTILPQVSAEIKKPLSHFTCDCLTKVFLEVLFCLEQCCEPSNDGRSSMHLFVMRQGVSVLLFLANNFPSAMAKSDSTFNIFQHVLVCLQRAFKKHEAKIPENEFNEFWNFSQKYTEV